MQSAASAASASADKEGLRARASRIRLKNGRPYCRLPRGPRFLHVCRRWLTFFIRAFVLLSGSFAAAFGFLAATRSPLANYDPYMFAVGVASLFGAACGAIGILFGRLAAMRREIKGLQDCAETLADRNWELKEAEERAKSFLDSQGDVIVRRDGENRITYANDAFCQLAGRPREELLGTAFELPIGEQGETKELADGTRVHDQKITANGSERWIAWRDVVIRRGESGTEVQSSGRDVTDRVQAERALTVARDQAESASRAKSRFLAMISHEIRTPLHGILGMSDLLLDTPLTPEQTAYARAVKTSGETLLSLIEEILDFSKIEAGRLDVEIRPFELASLIEEIIELVAPRAQAKKLAIASYLDDALPAWISGDATLLRQVLLNLLGNAIKFTERGGVALVVAAGAEGEISFIVRDTGIGIEPLAQERIFLEFEQAESGAARRFAGSGLGLAISKRLMEGMGGRIGLESVPGQGSSFTVTLPLPAAIRPDETDYSCARLRPDLAGMDVLIVAQSLIEPELLARRLSGWGARPCFVAEGAISEAMLAERTWGAILVDHDVAAELWARLAAYSAIPRRLVLITPAERREIPALQAAGFTDYLVKPVRAASLAARLSGAGRGVEAVPKMSAAREAGPRESLCGTKGLSILVAEDNEINALLATALLTKLGHHPTVAMTGHEAVERWGAARAAGSAYDLVLMDLHMAGSDGLEATRRIREAEANGPRTPIYALSADARAEHRDAALAAGMDGFLTKPLDRERLLDVLARIEATAPLAA